MQTISSHTINSAVENLKDVKSIFNLFEILGYKEYLRDESYKRKPDDFSFNKEITANIKSVYSIFNIEKHLFCFLIEADKFSKSFLRGISKKLIDSYIRIMIISTDDWDNYYFTLPQYEKKEGESKLKLSTLHLNTAQIYHTDLEIISNLKIENTLSYRDIWRSWQNAFSKERVNEEFYKDFQSIFFNLRNYVFEQCADIKISHEFTQQTLNRIMFLYFIAKKGWLNSDPIFIPNFYKNYKIARNSGNTPPDSFYEHWLSVLFFEVFNKSYPNMGIAKFIPDDLKNQLVLFPYLNGGLFKKDDFDKHNITISDSKFDQIFSFLDKYNFTIKEDLPLEVEVAVDPQMLGYLYESFANVAEEIYERNDLGIFYTSTVEVDFMVKLSLVEYFLNHISKNKVPHNIIYRFVFDEDKKVAIDYFSHHKLWDDINFLLNDIKVVDPACGSGAFLLGYLKILVELTKITERFLGYPRSDFDLKKEIIGKNLFGVDIMKWALHCAELRLWLSMIVEEDLPADRRKEPLLPNFNLRLRVGDSLVQKIGNINFNLEDLSVPREIKRKLEYLRKEKDKFYRNDPAAKFKTFEGIHNEENKLFCEILKSEEIRITKEIQILNIKLRDKEQLTFYGKINRDKESLDTREEIARKVESFQKQKRDITNILGELGTKGKQFIIWEIDFADVFQDKKGFDVVIGNPPYIRQENIAPPFMAREEVTIKEKTQYKEALIENIRIKYPFLKKFDKKSDYYIYFHFKGLSLLNPQGTFCFITSNSWLDVGYGKVLQEFLAKYVPIKAIFDNQSVRSFAHASVNTVITLFGSPTLKDKNRPTPTSLDNIAKFVMLKKPFEEVISYKNLVAIRNFLPDRENLFGNTYKNEDFRIYAISQKELLLEGIDKKEQENKVFKGIIIGEYEGAKWGGKYLRAPDIYFTILEKGKDKLVRLGDLADIRRGFTTGSNDFFYVEDVTDKIDFLKIKSKIRNLGTISSPEEIKDKKLRIVFNNSGNDYWLVEKEFLNPVVKSPRECKTILVRIEDLKYKVFLCDKSKTELRGTKALDYILWGEKQNYHKRPTCATRKYWWGLGKQAIPFCSYPMINNDRLIFSLNQGICNDANLVGVYPKKESGINLLYSLNATYNMLNMEILGIANLGDGAIKQNPIYIRNSIIIEPMYIQIDDSKKLFQRDIKSIFQEVGFDLIKPLREQQPNPLPDRKALDDIVFDVLGLTEAERKEVYWATAELVKNRLDKARSLKKK